MSAAELPEASIEGLATDGEAVFASVRRSPHEGAAERVRAIATHGPDVYWAAPGAIRRGGDAAPLVTTDLMVWDLVVDDAHVYWSEKDAHVCTGVLVAPRAGGERRRLDARCSDAIVRTSHGVFWSVRYPVAGVVTAPGL